MHVSDLLSVTLDVYQHDSVIQLLIVMTRHARYFNYVSNVRKADIMHLIGGISHVPHVQYTYN